ncbi:MAG: hypothetical protein QXP01_00215 [Candidatus Hadarchaeum sp.]
MTKRIIFLVAVITIACRVQAQGLQLPVALNAVPNSEVRLALVSHRFVDRISGLVRDEDGDNLGSWQAAPGTRILVVTLRVDKPKGTRFELHQGDYTLAYRDTRDESWDERSKATAFRILGGPDDTSAFWIISPTGYAARREPDLDGSSEVFIELAFLLQDGVRQVALQHARPVLALQLTNGVQLGSTRY